MFCALLETANSTLMLPFRKNMKKDASLQGCVCSVLSVLCLFSSTVEDFERHLRPDRENHLGPPDEPVGLPGGSPADQHQAGRGSGEEC